MFVLRACNGLCSWRKLQENTCKENENKATDMAKCPTFWSDLDLISDVYDTNVSPKH